MRKNIKYVIVLLIYLSAQSFFNPFGVFTSSTSKLIFYIFSLIGLITAMISGLKDRFILFPKKSYMMILLGMIFSTIMVSAFHDQSLIVSVMSTMQYFCGYLFLYILFKMNISSKRIEHTLQFLVVCSAICYFVNLLCFPKRIFGVDVDVDDIDMTRGFARLGVPMIELIVLYLFYSINRWLLTKEKKWIFWMCLCGVLIILSLTRQYIIISMVLAILFIMKGSSTIKKILALTMIILFVTYVLPNIPIYKSMAELTQDQILQNKYGEENIRITAWKFYTVGFQTNNWTSIFGNGVPSVGHSEWGNQFAKITAPYFEGGNACFTSDVGWAGFYWFFGLIPTLGLIVLLIKGIMKKKSAEYTYLTYSLIFIFLSSFASNPNLYYPQVLGVCIMLYLTFTNNKNYSIKEKNGRVNHYR